jgi:uncharacterized protein
MNIAIFHGTEGSPRGNWFPWLRKKLETRHHVCVPPLPTPNGQTVTNWINATNAQIPNLDQYDVLIGHSCGASFLPHLILNQDLRPKKIIMVAAFSDKLGLPDYDALLHSFFLPDALLQRTRDHLAHHAIQTHLFHGDNDPYVPLAQAQHIATKLATPLTVIQSGGHLNAEFGYLTFPDLLDVIPS